MRGLLVVCRMKLGVNLIDQGDVHQAIISSGHIVSDGDLNRRLWFRLGCRLRLWLWLFLSDRDVRLSRLGIEVCLGQFLCRWHCSGTLGALGDLGLATLHCRVLTNPAVALLVEGVPRPTARRVAGGIPGKLLVTDWYHRVDLHRPRDRYFPHCLQLLSGLSHLLLRDKPVSHNRVLLRDAPVVEVARCLEDEPLLDS